MTALIMSGALTALAFIIILVQARQVGRYRDEATTNFKAAKDMFEKIAVLEANNDALEMACKTLKDSLDKENLARKTAENQLDSLMDEVIKHGDAPAILVEAINAKLAKIRNGAP